MQSIKLTHVPSISEEKIQISEEKVHGLLSQLWTDVSVSKVTPIYRPVFEAILVNGKTNEHRTVFLDGFTGQSLDES
jgi:hypothetical protein